MQKRFQVIFSLLTHKKYILTRACGFNLVREFPTNFSVAQFYQMSKPTMSIFQGDEFSRATIFPRAMSFPGRPRGPPLQYHARAVSFVFCRGGPRGRPGTRYPGTYP